MTRKLQRFSACQATRPTIALPWPAWARVSTSSARDQVPLIGLGLPWAVTVQVKVLSSPIRRSIVVSWAGCAFQLPVRTPGLTAAPPAAGRPVLPRDQKPSPMARAA